MDMHFTARDATDHSGSAAETGQETKLAIPLHLQRLERALRVDLLMRQVQSYVASDADEKANEMLVPLNKQQLRAIKTNAYNLSKVKKSKKWVKNVLIEKSSESDDCTDEDGDGDVTANEQMVQHLIKFQNFKRKVRKEIADSSPLTGSPAPALKPYKCYSSALLSSSLPQSFVGPEEKPVPAAKQATEAKAKRNRPAKSAPVKRKILIAGSETPVPCPTAQATVMSSSPIPLQRSETGSIADSVSVSTISTPPLPASLPPSLTLSVSDSVDSIKKFKLEKMLDQIPYDMTLPDEILQSESSDAVPSPSTALTDEIVYSTQLPDEIFDTEESSNSLLSQALSSPPSLVPAAGLFPAGCHKAATAPPTPTGLSGSMSSARSGPKNSVKWKAMRRSNNVPLTLTAVSASVSLSQSSPLNQEALVSAKRKKVWAAVLKCIPKTQEQVWSERQSGLANCKRISGWCREQRGSILKRWATLVAADSENHLRRQMLSFWGINIPVEDEKPAEDAAVIVESVEEIFAHSDVHNVCSLEHKE